MHVVLEVVEVVTDQLGDDPILLGHLLLHLHHLRPRRMELFFQGLDPTKLFGLHNHHVVRTVHRVVGLEREGQISQYQQRIYSSTDHCLNIRHRMIQTGPDDTDQLLTSVNHSQVWPLAIAPVPLLHASLHLSRIVGCQRQTLETMMSRHRARRNKVVQR